MKDMEEKIQEILHYHTGKPSEDIIPMATCDDLGIDSLDFLEIVIDLEDKFNILISDEEADYWNTVQDIYNFVQGKITTPAPAEEKLKDDNQV